MRSSIIGQGRHRLGLPDSVPVRQFVVVHQQNLLLRLLGLGRRWGRHHDLRTTVSTSRSAEPALTTATA